MGHPSTLQRNDEKERGRDGSQALEACAAWDLGHRPFGSQGKQDCLCYWKGNGENEVAMVAKH